MIDYVASYDHMCSLAGIPVCQGERVCEVCERYDAQEVPE